MLELPLIPCPRRIIDPLQSGSILTFFTKVTLLVKREIEKSSIHSQKQPLESANLI